MGSLVQFHGHPRFGFGTSKGKSFNSRLIRTQSLGFSRLVRCSYGNNDGYDSRRDQPQQQPSQPSTQSTGIRLYSEIERYGHHGQLGSASAFLVFKFLGFY